MEPVTTVVHGLSTLLAIAAFGYVWNSVVVNAGVRSRTQLWYYVADWAMANGDAAKLREMRREQYGRARGGQSYEISN